MAPFDPERRKFFRHRINAPLKLRVTDNSPSVQTDSMDISLGGLSFLWAKKLSKGSLLAIEIPVKGKIFEVRGKVAYIREDRKTGRYRMGVSFVDASSAFKAKLAEEALEIMEYRKKISSHLGHPVTEEEAAITWIKANAAQFSSQFGETSSS